MLSGCSRIFNPDFAEIKDANAVWRAGFDSEYLNPKSHKYINPKRTVRIIPSDYFLGNVLGLEVTIFALIHKYNADYYKPYAAFEKVAAQVIQQRGYCPHGYELLKKPVLCYFSTASMVQKFVCKSKSKPYSKSIGGKNNR